MSGPSELPGTPPKHYTRDVASLYGDEVKVLARWAEHEHAIAVVDELAAGVRVVYALDLVQLERLVNTLAPTGVSWLRRLIDAGHKFEWSPRAIGLAHAAAEALHDIEDTRALAHRWAAELRGRFAVTDGVRVDGFVRVAHEWLPEELDSNEREQLYGRVIAIMAAEVERRRHNRREWEAKGYPAGKVGEFHRHAVLFDGLPDNDRDALALAVAQTLGGVFAEDHHARHVRALAGKPDAADSLAHRLCEVAGWPS